MMKRALLLCAFGVLTTLSFAQDDTLRTRLVIETDSGNITVELYNETPLHKENFIKLANEGFYDGVTFHRVIERFMIQGGNPATKEGQEGKPDGPGYTIPAELNGNFVHKKGALCAARQGDNVNPHRASSGSQFYIVHGRKFEDKDLDMFEQRINQDIRNKAMQAFFARKENKEYLDRLKAAKQEANQEELKAVTDEVTPMIDAWMENKHFSYSEEQREVYKTLGGAPHLDMQYTIFGEVVDGLDVVDKIAGCPKQGEMPDPAIRMNIRVVE